MKPLVGRVSSLPFGALLVAGFALVAAITIGVGAAATSRVIGDYLTVATSERVARDMELARAFYDIKLREIAGISNRLAVDPVVVAGLPAAGGGGASAAGTIDMQIANKVTVLALGGSHFVAVLDPQGNVLAGRLVGAGGEQTPVSGGGAWSTLPIVQRALATGQAAASTEVVPAEFLAGVGLNEAASIVLVETPKAAPYPFDSREGTAGLAMVGVAPVKDTAGRVIGLAMAFHLFNNDHTLVDQIRDVAGIDSVTVFFGDLRVSTNVLTQDGQRAVGTRLSQEVSQVLLEQGRQYTGRAFVVNEDYITRYEPLVDHTGHVVGSLYVGVRLAGFASLVNTFNEQIVVIALATILLAIALAIPFARYVTTPVARLVAANSRVALGDLLVRVEPSGPRELAGLALSFNSMAEGLYVHQVAQQEKVASIGQLAAGVAHEINNPLGTIMLYADILTQQYGSNPQSRADLSTIVNEAKRCKRIVSALLDFSRQTRIVPQPTNVNELVRAVLEVEQRRVGGGTVTFDPDLDSRLPSIQADPSQLRQVLINLVANALDAMPEGGTLTVRTRPICTVASLEGTVAADAVLVEVQDTGRGIAPENINKVFLPFFTTKSLGTGMGLGLAISHGIIKMHDGQIAVRSQVGQGTTVAVTLPIVLREPPTGSAGSPGSA